MPAPRNGARRPIAKKSGPNPVVMISGVGVLIVLIGIMVALYIQRTNIENENQKPAEEQYDPNEDIRKLQLDFDKLQGLTTKVLKMDREHQAFEKNVNVMKKKWKAWQARFDKIFDQVRGSDGEWPAEYRHYSGSKWRSQQWYHDLVKTGGF